MAMLYDNTNDNCKTTSTSATEDPYILSEWDRLTFDIQVPFFAIYKWDDHGATSCQILVDSMQHGLEKAAEQLPSIAAKIHLDDQGRALPRMSPTKLTLKVRNFGPDEYKSYEEIARRSFLTDDIDVSRLMPGPEPASTTGANERIRNACFIQLNFIPGGIILSLGVNHRVGDAASIGKIALLICECTKACLENRPIPHHEYNFDRLPFLPPPTIATSVTKMTPISLSREEGFLVGDTATLVATLSTPIPADQAKGLTYRITHSDAVRLKGLCKPIGVGYVSTYDCITGLLFRAIVRARATINTSFLQLESNKKWYLTSASDLRHRNLLPTEYFGNGVKCVFTDPLSGSDILGHDGYSLIASKGRHSIQNNDGLSFFHRAVATAEKSLPNESVIYVPVGVPDSTHVVSSWYTVGAEKWDFGIGRPSAMRTFTIPAPNFSIIFPACEQNAYDIYVCLPEQEHDMLNKDEEFQSWFQVL